MEQFLSGRTVEGDLVYGCVCGVQLPVADAPCEVSALAGLPLAMAYVPMQCWAQTYEPAVGLCRGTIFPELDLPFLAAGGCAK